MAVFRIARGSDAHLPEILGIEAEANPSPWGSSSFEHEFTNPHGLFQVALLDGKVVGYGGIWFVIDEAHVTTLAVSNAHRREKIGQRLVSDLLIAAKDEGMMCATLEVRAGNQAAIQLYKNLGFESVATRKKYYPNDQADALVMWLYNLDQWTAPKTIQ